MAKKNHTKEQMLREMACKKYIDILRNKLELIKNKIEPSYKEEVQNIVFISISNQSSRAIVRHGIGEDFEEALKEAQTYIEKVIQKKQYAPDWVKVDFVIGKEKLSLEELKSTIKRCEKGFFRKGIALDTDFNRAYLECELNSRGMIDYKKGEVSVDKMPLTVEEVIVFLHKGFFCDEKQNVFELYEDEKDFGRRVQAPFEENGIKEVINHVSEYLVTMQKGDGSFIYGYSPTKDKVLPGYNILRHAGTIWGLICGYQVTGNPRLLETIQKATHYLINEHVVYKDEDTAYILERKNNELKLGGNGITIVSLMAYKELFKEEAYNKLLIALGNGILTYLDKEKGSYSHVLNYSDYRLKETFRTIYYDGEATFALLKLYELTGEEKWLSAAKSAVENFIAQDYTRYRDHWIAYSMNELIKYCPEERYIAFALKNAMANLEVIKKKKTINPTSLELLMATYEMYKRLPQQFRYKDILTQQEEQRFLETIHSRVSLMQNGYFYSEYAMYMKKPQVIYQSIFIRDDKMRVRIDDLQHFLGGYSKYYLHFIQSMNKEEKNKM